MYPILFEIGPLSLKSYGLMLMVAFVVGLALAIKEGRKEKIKSDPIINLVLWIILSSIIFARLVFVLLEWEIYRKDPLRAFKIWAEGGLSFHGGVLGGIIATLWFSRKTKLSFGKLADLLTPSLALGYGIGRIGCLLNGCCYGKPTSLPWGLQFRDWTQPGGPLTPPSHPTQIYASLAGVTIFFILRRLKPYKRKEGQLFLSFLMLYSIYRFFIEFLRKGVTAEILFKGLTQAQFASLVIIVISGLIMRTFVLKGSGSGFARGRESCS